MQEFRYLRTGGWGRIRPDRILIEQRVSNDSPSVAVAYLLWLFLWFSDELL